MSKLMASLSGKTQEEWQETIHKLEELSGFPSEDVRQLATATQELRLKITQLGLDPDDTTGPELYHALLARYSTDAASLDRAVNIKETSSLTERAAKASELTAQTLEPKETWALKNSVAKKLIKDNPPKKLMKKLHYRSVDSMLKREDITSIFIGADLVELSTWHRKMEAKIAKLSTANYELRPFKIASLKLDALAGCAADQAVVANAQVGAAAIAPNAPSNTPVLTLALFLIDSLEGLSEDRLVNKLHVVHPRLNWWIDTEHLLSFNDSQPVSLNFKDIAQNHLLDKSYEDRTCQAGHQAFWSRLMNGYKKYIDELPQELAAADRALDKKLAPVHELAPELVEV